MGNVPACDEDLVRRLPLPLAQLYRRAHNAKTPLERHLTAYYLWEASLKLLGSVAIVTYADLGRHEPQVAERLQNLARPALGHWWEFVRLLLPVLAEGDEGFRQARDLLLGRTRDDLPRAAGLDACLREALDGQAGARSTVRLAELFDRLVRYRNRELGHGAAGQAAAGVYERVGGNLLLGVAEILGRLDVLAGRRLVYVAEVRRQASGDWLVEPYELTGESARRMPSLTVSDAAALPHPERVYVARPVADGAEAGPLSPLHPLVTYDPETAEAFFLNSRRGARRGEYLCYATGRVADRRDVGGEQRELLARVLGLAVDEAAVGEWAARSQAEEPISEPKESNPAAPPRRVGEFEILSELGRGGMGVVYRAWQPSLGRQVALKSLLRAGDAKAEARFGREIRALGKVDHPHLVKIFTSGCEGDHWFYAMELIDGVSLGALCERLAGTTASAVGAAEWQKALTNAYEEERKKEKTAGDRPPTSPGAPKPPAPTGRGHVAQVVEIVRQVTEAAHALHEAGVIHRDVKPGNVVLTPDGSHAVLMDLGLAQLADDVEGRLTRTRQFVGTLRYASPEQVLAVGGLDRRSDIYSLGATLWELLALRPIYGATEQTPTPELMRRIQYEEPERLRKVNPGVPADLEAVVLKCLEKNPARRYATAAELADDLGRFQRGEPVRARPIGDLARLGRWCRRRPLVPGIAAALLLLFLVGFALVFWQWRRAERNADLAERHFQGTLNAANTMVDKLAVELKPIAGARRETVANILRDAEAIYDGLPEDARQRPEVRRGKARMLTSFSEVYRDLGDSGKALAAAAGARDVYTELRRRDPADAALRRGLAQSLVQAGIALMTRGDSNGALAAYRESLTLREELAAEDPADLDRQRDVAESQSRVGWVLLTHRETARTKALFEEALATRRRLAEGNPDDARSLKDLTNAHLNAGDVHSAEWDKAKAIAAYREGVTLAERLVGRASDNLEWQELLCRARTTLGDLYLQNGELKEAIGTLGPALEIARRQVARDPANATWQGHLIYVSVLLANTRADPEKPVEDLNRKLTGWQDWLALCERRLREDPADVTWLGRRAGCHTQVGLCRVGLARADVSPDENYSRAAAELETSVAEWQRLTDSDPDNGNWATSLTVALGRLAGVYGVWKIGSGASLVEVEGRVAAGRELLLELLDGTAGDHKTDVNLQRWLLAPCPGDTAVRKRLVAELQAAWRWKEAAREQERVVRDLGKDVTASDYELLAELQIGMGDTDRAAETFRAAKHDPAEPAARRFAILVVWQQRRFGAVRDLASRLAADPKASAEQKQLAEVALAGAEVETGVIADAEARVRRALAATPKGAYWLYWLGYLLAAQGKNLDDAEQWTWGWLGDVDPRSLWVWGWVLALQNKQGPRGLQIMEQVASHELVAHDPIFFDHLGDAYRLAGQTDKARAAWQKSLSLFPTTAAPDDRRKLSVERKLKDLPGG